MYTDAQIIIPNNLVKVFWENNKIPHTLRIHYQDNHIGNATQDYRLNCDVEMFFERQ